MTEKKSTTTTFGLKPEKLAHLLRLGDSAEESHEVSQDQEKADYLRNCLAGTLPLDSSIADTLPTALSKFCDTIGAISNEPIGKLLLDSNTELDVIRKVKDHCKKLSRNSVSEVELFGANTIYYAAIASALVFHSQQITRFTWEELNHSFHVLEKEKWISKDFTDLFIKAEQYCQNKMKEKT